MLSAVHPPGLPSRKTREISGEAALPENESEPIEDSEIPKPPQVEEVEKGEYEEAKGEFKRKLAGEEIQQKAQEQSDDMLEQYAKENVVWLYEIYKMGGVSREEFLQKMREKLAAEKSGADGKPGPWH